jgi:protein gp37
MTWNPVTGCTKLSQGCKNCYAERMAKRLKLMGSERYENGFAVTMHEDLVELPKRWKKPRTIFVNSMSDLFHPDVSIDFIRRIFVTMGECPQHTFQVLTKRADRLAGMANKFNWPTNVWMGVSVEDERVLERVDYLRQVPASVRFLSCEPLIGPLRNMNLVEIDWVIVGGESGPRSRPMALSWVEDIRRQCEEAGVAFFFKQWGGIQKHRTGRQLNGRTYDEMPRPACE